MTTNNFYLDFNVTGTERKRLVQAISAFMGADAKYLGAPSFAYSVDYFTIDRNGVVSFDDRADSEEIEGLIETLVNEGFVSQVSNLGCEDDADSAAREGDTAPENETTANPTEAATAPQSESVGCGCPVDTSVAGRSTDRADRRDLTVRIPLDKVAVGNLTRLLEAKGTLIKNALGIADLPISIEEDTVAFPWFEELPGADEVKAYTHLIATLCEMSKNQKRITATEKEVDNEKYAFRCFLLRLGFIGAEFKTERKILLRNLSGSSAFKISKDTGSDD